MKVLIIPSWYSTKRNEIAGVFVREQCKALLKTGVDLDILFADLYPLNVFNPSAWFKNSYRIEKGIPVFRVNGFFFPKRNNLFAKAWCKLYLNLFKLYINKVQRPDIIHAHSYFAGMIASAIKREYGIPYVFTEHHSGFMDKSIPGWQFEIISDVLDNADSIIALNNNLKSQLLKFTNKEVIILPNLIDSLVFKYKERTKGKVFKIITIGFLIKRKGYDILINAISLLIKRHSTKVELTIIGEGSERKLLEKMIQDLGLSASVYLPGKIDHESLPEYLYNADLFVSSSYAETQGVAISQALCTGLPVVSTAVGGLTENITTKNGKLVPPGDAEAMATAIKYIIDNYEHYDNKLISSKAMNLYDPDMIVEKLKSIYENTV